MPEDVPTSSGADKGMTRTLLTVRCRCSTCGGEKKCVEGAKACKPRSQYAVLTVSSGCILAIFAFAITIFTELVKKSKVGKAEGEITFEQEGKESMDAGEEKRSVIVEMFIAVGNA